MEEKNDVILEAGKHLVRGLLILQFKPNEIMEIIEMLIEDHHIIEMLKWFQQEVPTIMNLIEKNELENVKGLVFEKASEIVNDKTTTETA